MWTAWRGPPLPCAGHRGGSLVAGESGGLALLFGSDEADSDLPDELVLDLDAWQWRASERSERKRQRRSEQVVLEARGSLFVHGGCPEDPFVRRRGTDGQWAATRLELGCVRGACIVQTRVVPLG